MTREQLIQEEAKKQCSKCDSDDEIVTVAPATILPMPKETDDDDLYDALDPPYSPVKGPVVKLEIEEVTEVAITQNQLASVLFGDEEEGY